MTNKSRRNTLKQVKGYRFARSKKKRAAYEAIVHAGKYAFAHRRDKKNDFRKLWNVRINAALDAQINGLEGAEAMLGKRTLSYSRLMSGLRKHNIALNRKMLAEIAAKSPTTFERIAKKLLRKTATFPL
jgi:large subunit ribosomal protein L20